MVPHKGLQVQVVEAVVCVLKASGMTFVQGIMSFGPPFFCRELSLTYLWSDVNAVTPWSFLPTVMFGP